MNSYSASSVQFLTSITNGWPIVAGAMFLLAIMLFAARYYLSPDPEPQKRVTLSKKFSQSCAAFLIIAVFLGTGFGTKAFEYFANGNSGTNKDIAGNASSSLDVSGTQYSPYVKKKETWMSQRNNSQSLSDVDTSDPESAQDIIDIKTNQGEYAGYADMYEPIKNGFSEWVDKNIGNYKTPTGAPVTAVPTTNGSNVGEEEKQNFQNSGIQNWLNQTEENRKNLANSNKLLPNY